MWQPHLKELALTGSYLKECIPDLDKEASGSSKSPLASSALLSTNATLIAANRCFSIFMLILHNSIFISLKKLFQLLGTKPSSPLFAAATELRRLSHAARWGEFATLLQTDTSHSGASFLLTQTLKCILIDPDF